MVVVEKRRYWSGKGIEVGWEMMMMVSSSDGWWGWGRRVLKGGTTEMKNFRGSEGGRLTRGSGSFSLVCILVSA